MAVFQKLVWAFKCEPCEHEWIPRTPWDQEEKSLPRVCPLCKSPYWNKPRKYVCGTCGNPARWKCRTEAPGLGPDIVNERYFCDEHHTRSDRWTSYPL